MSLTEETLNEQLACGLLDSVEAMLDKLYHGLSREISFKDGYDTLYRLVNADRGTQMEETITRHMRRIFLTELSGLNPENSFLEELTRRLVHLLSGVQKMMKLFFRVESIYFLEQGRGSLRHITYAILKEVLMGEEALFGRFVNELCVLAFAVRGNKAKDYGLFRDAVGAIASIDLAPQTPSIFAGYIAPKYMELLQAVNRRLVREQKMPISDLLLTIYSSYGQQRAFLTEYFSEAGSKKVQEQMLRCFYDSLITTNIERFLALPDSNRLFQEHLCILHKLAKLDESAYQRFSNFFLEALGKKLERLDPSKCVVRQFSGLYQRTSADLSEFDASLVARVKLTFEAWLNKEARTINKLNSYISELLENISSNKENSQLSGMTDFMVIFKFIKDKDMFERGYRRLLVERIIAGTVEPLFEQQLIGVMREECGAHWTKSIEGLLEELPAVSTFAHAKIFSELNWPFNENFKWILNKELLDLKQQTVKQYHQMHPSRMLRWHPMLGYGVALLQLNSGAVKLQMTTAMLNFLLSFNVDKEVRLGKWVHERHLDFEAMRKHIFSLIHSGLLSASEPVTDPFQLTDATKLYLNLDFSVPAEKSIPLLAEDASFELVRREELSVDRKVMVDSIIIRYLKHHKTSSQAQFFERVSLLIEKKGFSPNTKFIESCLADLMSRDFVKKSESGQYSYIS